MRIAVDVVGADIFKLRLLFQCLPAIIKEIHGGKFAVEEHRYAYLHRMNPVFHHRRTLDLLAAVGVVYIYRLDLVEQGIGTEPDQDISHAGRATHTDES